MLFHQGLDCTADRNRDHGDDGETRNLVVHHPGAVSVASVICRRVITEAPTMVGMCRNNDPSLVLVNKAVHDGCQ